MPYTDGSSQLQLIPCSQSGGTLGRKHFRKSRMPQRRCVGTEGKNRVKTISAESKIREEGAEVLWALEQDSPAALGEDHEEQTSTVEDTGGARHFLKQAAASEEEPAGTGSPGKNCGPWRTHTGAGLSCRTVEWTHTGAVCEGLQPAVRTHTGSGAQCEEEGVARRKHYGLTAASHFPAPVLLGRVEEVEVVQM